MVTRRDLLRRATLVGAGLGLVGFDPQKEALANDQPPAETPEENYGSMVGVKFEPRSVVRVGIVGLGNRGSSMLPEFLALENVLVTAICDVDKDRVLAAQSAIEKAGQPSPALHSNGDHDFENLCKRDDVDFVYTPTPWDWHVPVALAAMSNGKHVGIEVPAATTLQDCWSLVTASEKNRRHCLIMENCCYGYNELMVLKMLKAGLLGEALHGECAYDHDLRDELFWTNHSGLWRRFPHTTKDGNLYPTHGLGPMARYMNINRGDRFDHLVSMSSPERGLTLYREQHVPREDPRWKETYKCGDVNTSLIKTASGRTIMLQHAVTTPRPYDRINLLSCTKGIFRDYPARLFLDQTQGREQWMGAEEYNKIRSEYEPDLWQRVGQTARQKGGHGGMDFIMLYRLTECIRKGLAPDIDVYDAAAWSVVGPLSELSVAQGGLPIKFPDFTRGKWAEERREAAGSKTPFCGAALPIYPLRTTSSAT
jgi:hypothetical protein